MNCVLLFQTWSCAMSYTERLSEAVMRESWRPGPDWPDVAIINYHCDLLTNKY